jgi:hypothetical protein
LLQNGNFLNIERGEFQMFSEKNGTDDEVSLIWKTILEKNINPSRIKKESRKNF